MLAIIFLIVYLATDVLDKLTPGWAMVIFFLLLLAEND